MPRLTHDDAGMTFACPCCGAGGQVYERTGNGNATKDPDRPFRCEKCGGTFTIVVERECQAGKKESIGKAVWQRQRERILDSHGLLDGVPHAD